MKTAIFKVVKTGLYTSFQDLGRYGYQRFGVVTGGAMDTYSAQLANILVGNRREEVCLEVTMIGPHLLVEAPTLLLAVCGANLSLTVNGNPAPLWRSFRVSKGDVLRFGKPVSGMRAYLAVAGGYDVQEMLGSRSYYEKAKLGTRISEGDVLYGFVSGGYDKKGIALRYIPSFQKDIVVRVIMGPHDGQFITDSVQQFWKDKYVVTQGDRMGYRIKGASPLVHTETADIPSEAIPLGGIQVPSNGEPIILLADRQTTGGYTRIATVISVDIYKISQLPPGGTIRFSPCTLEEAHELYRKRENFLKRLHDSAF